MSEETVVVAPEERARLQGWVPQDEYNGDPDKWKTAEQFIEDGEKYSAVSAERNRKLTAELAEIKRFQKEQFEISRRELEAVRKEAYERAVRELKARQREAVAIGDTDEFDKIQEQIENVEKPKPITMPEKKEVSLDPVFVDWHAKNPWYGENKTASRFADTIVEDIKNTGLYSSTAAILKAVESEVKKRFPELGEGKKEPDVESPSGGSQDTAKKSGKYSYATLPEDAKKACDSYVKQKLMTREQYVAEYYK